MKKLLVFCLFLAGCGTYNVTEHIPQTQEERDCVIKVEQELMSRVPKTLSGHDQDWDDAIKAAHNAALNTCVQPVLVEYKSFGNEPTGKIKKYSKAQ
jgi:formate dehydrogenase assembly factor FdhD